MAFQPRHDGLYFTQAQVETARKHLEHEPFEAAWVLLREREFTGIESAQWHALRWRFADDQNAGKGAVKSLLDCVSTGFDAKQTYFDAVRDLLTLAHAFEILRDGPHMSSEASQEFRTLFQQHDDYLQTVEYDRSYIETLWQGLLSLVSGIVLEDETRFQKGVAAYQRTIGHIHPRGYIPQLVEARDGGGLLRSVLAVSALTLMAEAAVHVGIDLWHYSERQVSIMTLFAYLPYYYHYPEKWPWESGATNEPFTAYGGFLEIINQRANPKEMKAILYDLRPLYDPAGGGLTTLSHGLLPKRGLFG